MASSIKIVIDDSVRERIEVAMKSGVKIWNAESVYLDDFLRINIVDFECIRVINDKYNSRTDVWTKCLKEKEEPLEVSISFILTEINEDESELRICVYCNMVPICDFKIKDQNPDYISLSEDDSLYGLNNLVIRLSSFSLKEEE